MPSDKAKQRLVEALARGIPAGETVEFASIGEVGQFTAKQVLKGIGKSLGVAALTAGTMMTIPRPRIMRVALTGRSLVFFGTSQETRRGQAPRPLMVLPRQGLQCSPVKTIGLTRRITVGYAGEPRPLRLTFHLGRRKDANFFAEKLGGPVDA